MCGKVGEVLRTLIEGVEMNVCRNCSKHGKVLKKVMVHGILPKKNKPVKVVEEKVDVIVDDYADRIKKKREELGLKQEELAKKISEKESLLHKIESGKFEPSMGFAKKLERFLKITLIEEEKMEKEVSSGTNKSEGFTIGDMIKK